MAAFLVAGSARAQWEILLSGSTADLRGIHSVGNGVAWASGTQGTVLRTTDEGKSWERCATPPGAEGLDFRGVQAFDANTAIVMSSGKGDLSRLYKTVDGCKSWKLVFTNPDVDGFWDAALRTQDKKIYVLGDPANGQFAMFLSEDDGQTWFAAGESGREAHQNESAFAASNSSITSYGPYLLFGTGGSGSAHIYKTGAKCSPPPDHPDAPAVFNCTVVWNSTEAPLASGSPASGVFSLGTLEFKAKDGSISAVVVAVGGVYDKPDDSTGTAAVSFDGSKTWIAAKTTPHGYRSAVAYDAVNKTWITVGPNGTDVSTDDGRNWRALRPNVAAGEAADADQHWNALSLPFVVGPKGRIGKLNAKALAP